MHFIHTNSHTLLSFISQYDMDIECASNHNPNSSPHSGQKLTKQRRSLLCVHNHEQANPAVSASLEGAQMAEMKINLEPLTLHPVGATVRGATIIATTDIHT